MGPRSRPEHDVIIKRELAHELVAFVRPSPYVGLKHHQLKRQPPKESPLGSGNP